MASQELISDLAEAIVKGNDSKILEILRSRWPLEVSKRKFPTGGEVLSDTAKKVSSLLQGTGPINMRNLPKEYKNIGIQIIPGLDLRNLNASTFSNFTPKQRQVAIENIIAYARQGDPNFYWDLNKLQAAAAPGVDPRLSAFTFAPFSAGQGLDRNSWLWRKFIEYPELYSGNFGGGNMATGPAYRSAIKQIIDGLPRPELLRSQGEPVIKLGSFGENIAEPGMSRRATMDIHATRNPVGIYLPEQFMPPVTSTRLVGGGESGAYRPLEKLFIDAAEQTGMLPHEMQSAAWDTARQINQRETTGMLSPAEFSPIDVSPIIGLPPTMRKALFERLDAIRGIEKNLGQYFR